MIVIAGDAKKPRDNGRMTTPASPLSNLVWATLVADRLLKSH